MRRRSRWKEKEVKRRKRKEEDGRRENGEIEHKDKQNKPPSFSQDIEKKENDDDDDDEEEDTERMSSLSFSTYHSLMDTGLQRILKTVKKTTSTGRKSRTLLRTGGASEGTRTLSRTSRVLVPDVFWGIRAVWRVAVMCVNQSIQES